ncbi:13450_t:CDS:2, partial [Entrophospora sp. SA101]
ICLYIGKEKYETLATVCKIFDSQITSLKAHGKKNPSLFTSIELLNYVPDELHILLRITDVLMECLFKDLFKKKK